MRALPMHPHPHLRAFIKWALIVMIVLFAARALHAEVAKIVNTYAAPGGAPRGIAWDGTNIWLVDDLEKLYKLDPATFSTISWCSVGGYDRSGLTWDGSYLWTVNDGAGMTKVDGSCAVLDSNDFGYWSYSGAAWGGGYLWMVDYNFGTCYQLNPDGTEVRHWSISWPISGYSHATGVFHDGTNVWIGDSGRIIGKFNSTGTPLFSIDLTTDLGLSTAYGLVEFTWDPNYLWVSRSDGFDVYKVAVCGTVAVSPSLLPNVALNGVYSQSLSALGERGTSPFTFAVTAGSLPPGLTLATDGSLSGTATTAGPYNFTVTATGANTCTATKDYSVIVAGPPSVTTVTPNKGTVDGGTNVTIAGSGFQTGATVTFGGLAATNVVVVTTSSITATTPAHSFGSVDVVVTNSDAQTATLTNGFTYEVPMPSVSPCAGPPSGGYQVTFTGNGLAGATAVTFDGSDAPIVSSSGNSITVTAPVHAAGAVTVEMTLPGGNLTFTDAYRYYTPPAAVEWSFAGLNGLDVFALGVSPTNADTVYAGFGTGTGIDKTTAGGGSWTQISSNYGVYAFAIDPTNPNIVYTGKFKSIDAGGTWTTVESGYYHRAVAINPLTTSIVYSGHPYDGIRKSTSSGALWSIVFGSSYIHSLAIDPQNPNNVYAGAETYSSTPGGVYRSINAGTSWTNVLSRTRVNAVVLDAAVPSRIYAAVEGEGVYRSEDGGATWTSPNTGLTHLLVRALISDPTDTNVLYAGTWEGGVYRSTDCGESWTQVNTGLGDTYLVSLATSPANSSIVYASGENGGVYRLATVPSPTINLVAPAKGTSLGGTAVTITGTTLRNAISVLFGGTAGAITANTDTSITVTTPPHALGTVDVVVTTTAGSTTVPSAFEYVTGPSITSVVPSRGSTMGGSSVTIAGANLVSGATVTIGGGAATGVVVSSSTSISATTPPHDAGAADVVVTNPDSVSGFLTGGFTYLDPPAIHPCSGPPAGGNSVTLTGTAVLGATAVTFDGLPAAITSSSGNTVTVTAPAHAAGAVTIAITSSGGTFSVSNAYRYYTPPLAVEWTRPSTKTDVFDGLAVDRNDVDRVFAASGSAFYGIQKSANGTADWSNCSTSNSYAVAIDPADSNKIFTGYQKSSDGGTTWSTAYSSGYGSRAVAIDPQTTSIYYVGTGGNGVARSVNSGTNWSTVMSSAFVRSLAVNPAITSIVYAGVETNASYTTPGGVHKTADSGTSWTPVLANARVNAVAVDPALPVRIYAATEDGGVYRSDDSGTTWSNPNGGLTPTAVRALAVNPEDSNVVYAATSGGGVFRSTDCGDTWSAINNGLTDLSPLSLGMSPADSSILYAGGGSGGVYRMSTIVPPTLSQITPASGTSNGGTVVTITGTNLERTTSVTFGGTAATSVSIVNSTTVTATTPSHAAGTVDVVVNNSVALTATLPDAFTFIDPPSVTSVSPNSGPITGGTSVTIAGAHFTSGATVKFGNTAATNVAVVDASTITATTPIAAVPGLVAITVTNPDGQFSTLPAAFSFLSPPGNDYYVNGTSGANTTSGGTLASPWKTITYALTRITGYGHTLHVAAGTYDTTLGETFPIMIKNGVSIHGLGAGTTIIDAGGSNVVLKAVGISDPGTTVQNFTIRGGGNTREGAGILITAGSVVRITNNLVTENTVSLADGTSHYGGGIQVLNASPQIVGNDIRGNVVISGFSTCSCLHAYGGGIAVSGATSSPTISQNVIANNEVKNEAFSNAAGGGIAIVDGATPTITDNTISANSLPRLAATADLNLGGAIYFEAAGGVVSGNTITSNTWGLSFGGVVATGAVHVTGASPTIRRNVIAGNDDHGIWCEASAAPLIENNTIVSSTLSGIYLASASPSITNNILYANTTFGIEESTTGSDPSSARYNLFFANGSGVYRDEGATDYFSAATLDTSVTECSNNLEGDPLFIDAGGGNYHVYFGSPVIDAGDPASDLDPDGSRADIGALPYAQASPVIDSITPSAGTTAGGTPITISGSNFASGAAVRLGSTAASNVTVVSASSITATTAPAAAGTVDVVVTNPDGLRGTLTGGFTYVSTPGYTSLAPAIGPAAGGTSVTITGVNLTGVISVTFGGSAGTVTANTSTSITVTTPAHAAGIVDVVINAAGGSVSAPAAFTYMAAPTITTITPNRGPTAGGTSVVIAGTNLADVTSVVFGGVTGTIVSKNATSLTATTPAHAAESSVWRAEAQVTEFTGDGLQGVSIAGARDSQGFPIPSNDTRFGFEIVTSGTSSFELQATGGPGRIDLSWTASTLDTLAGYNLYRATVSGGPYTKVNAALIAGTSYSDFAVTPNVPHYYVYRVVNTSLEEASDSNEATATPGDATAPIITHTSVSTATGGAPITIVATITDNLAVTAASVFYRAVGSTAAFTQVAMINATGSQYTANIPAAAAVAPGVEYYIEASDGTAISRHGSADAPHVVTIAATGGEPGDVTGDGSVDPDDVVFLINYFFGNGPAPGSGGDVNGDGQVTIADLYYLINYLFAGGAAP